MSVDLYDDCDAGGGAGWTPKASFRQRQSSLTKTCLAEVQVTTCRREKRAETDLAIAELEAPPFEVVMDVDVNYGGVDDRPRTFGGRLGRFVRGGRGRDGKRDVE